jgi:hypothetical protein
MDGLIEGRIVHYVCPSTMAHRPGIVVNVKDKEDGNEGTWHWVEKA